MKVPLTLVALSLLLLAVPPAAACEPTTSDPEVDTWKLGGQDTSMLPRWYVDNDVCQPECLFSVWIYEEGNGIDGLQRGDEVHDDTCGGEVERDGPYW